MSDDFFRDPVVAKALRGILRMKGVADQDLEDCTQEVYEAVLKWSQESGVDAPEELGKMAGTIAKRIGTSYWREGVVDGKHNAGATADADEHGPAHAPPAVDLLDARRALEAIDRMCAEGKLSMKGAAVLRAIVRGDTLQEHANETGQSHAAVRKIAQRSQEKVVVQLQERGMADIGLRRLLHPKVVAGAAFVAVIVLLAITGRLGGLFNQPVAHHDEPSPEPITPEIPPTPELMRDPVESLRAKREALDGKLSRADLDFMREDYGGCLQRLDEATKIDPSIDSSATRSACARGRERQLSGKWPQRKH